MKSPCGSCHLHQPSISKASEPKCLDCEKRLAYWIAMCGERRLEIDENLCVFCEKKPVKKKKMCAECLEMIKAADKEIKKKPPKGINSDNLLEV